MAQTTKVTRVRHLDMVGGRFEEYKEDKRNTNRASALHFALGRQAGIVLPCRPFCFLFIGLSLDRPRSTSELNACIVLC